MNNVLFPSCFKTITVSSSHSQLSHQRLVCLPAGTVYLKSQGPLLLPIPIGIQEEEHRAVLREAAASQTTSFSPLQNLPQLSNSHSASSAVSIARQSVLQEVDPEAAALRNRFFPIAVSHAARKSLSAWQVCACPQGSESNRFSGVWLIRLSMYLREALAELGPRTAEIGLQFSDLFVASDWHHAFSRLRADHSERYSVLGNVKFFITVEGFCPDLLGTIGAMYLDAGLENPSPGIGWRLHQDVRLGFWYWSLECVLSIQ